MVCIIHSIASLERDSGGPAHNVAALCDSLLALGAQVEIVSQEFKLSRGNNSDVVPTVAQVNFSQCYYSRRFRLGYSPAFQRVLEQRCRYSGAEIIHDHGLWLPTNHSAATVSRRLDTPLIVSPKGTLKPWALSHRVWKKRLAWRLYQFRDLQMARVLHATAEQEAENLRRLGLRQPIAVIPNGVELPQVADRPRRQGNQRVALFLSRIHPVKGLLGLVEAWRIARPTDWKVVVAGPDEDGHRRTVENAVRQANLESVFEFVGPIKDDAKTALYRQADLFVLPSFSENFGLVVAEALACEVPVLTTKGTPWEGLERNHCGWWVHIGVRPLADAIRHATSLNDDERREMGRRGRAYVEREFGLPGIAEQMLSVYEWVLGRDSRPDCLVMY